MAFVPDYSSQCRHQRQIFFVVHRRGLVARWREDALILPSGEELPALGLNAREAHRVGTLGESDVFVLPCTNEPSEPFQLIGLRALAAAMDADSFKAAGHATHMADWLSTSRFCGHCGSMTVRVETERCMACPTCDLRTYPRISPAIITLVRKGELALLASNAKFPGAFYSTLAGFSEIGESLEDTLLREVREETGVSVGNLRYFGSQPWPFPNSMMLAFTADWQGGELVIDTREISDARWFAREQLPELPPRLSIARQLIDAWLTEGLPR